MTWTYGGFQVLYGTGYTGGTGTKKTRAIWFNTIFNAIRGYGLLYDFGGTDNIYLKVSANASSDLTNSSQADIDIAAGYYYASTGRSAYISAQSLDLSGSYSKLSSGQSMFVLVYFDGGTTAKTLEGAVATTGEQHPPELPEKAIPLALIYLQYGDTVIDSNNIIDLRIPLQRSYYVFDNQGFIVGNSNDAKFYHDGTNTKLEHTGSGAFLLLDDASEGFYMYTHKSFKWRDLDDSNAVLMELNTDTRSFYIGTPTDVVSTYIYSIYPTNYSKTISSNQDMFVRMLAGGDGTYQRNLFFWFRSGGTPWSKSGIQISSYDTQAIRMWMSGATFYLRGTTDMDESGAQGDTWTTLTAWDVSNSVLAHYGDLKIPKDSKQLLLGAGGDFGLYHDGTNNIIKLNNGRLYIQGVDPSATAWVYGTKLWVKSDGTATYMELVDAGSVSINPSLFIYPKDGTGYGVFNIVSQVASDGSGVTTPAITIDGRVSGAALSNRPILVVQTYGSRKLTVESDGSLITPMQLLSYALYNDVSSTVSVSQSTAGSSENSLVAKDSGVIALGDALPRDDYSIKAGVYVSAVSGDANYVKVEILKDGTVTYTSDYVEITTTGNHIITIADGNASFTNARYGVKLWVKAASSGNATTITARIDSVTIFV